MIDRVHIRLGFWRLVFALMVGWRWWLDGMRALLPVSASGTRPPGAADMSRIELAADSVFMRRLELPVTALADLRRTVELSIARVTPFRPEDAIWDARVVGPVGRCQAVVVELVIVARDVAEAAIDGVRSRGLRLSSLGIEGDRGPERFELLPEARRRARVLRRWRWASVFLLLAMIFAADAAWQARLSRAYEQVVAATAALRGPAAEAAERRRAVETAARPGEIDRAAAAASTLVLLAELTRCLPEDVQIVELRREGREVSLTGLAGDAPAVLIAVEQSPRFEGARFTAALSRGPVDGRQLFALRAIFHGGDDE